MDYVTTSDIPPQQGRSVVVTGTGGIGYQVALALARAGGDVIIAGRNPARGAAAVSQIRQTIPAATVRFEVLDLANLPSVSDFALRLRQQTEGLDLLINNAAVMTPPVRHETSDGFELQFGTNYLGHYALTGQLLPLLRQGRSPRVVNLSSIAARAGAINFDNLQSERGYKPMVAYSQSKLANLMFSLELQRRSEAAGWGVASLAAHPGISRTDLIPNSAGKFSPASLIRTYLWFLFQPASQGALPPLFAATSPEAKAGGYYGPARLLETRGAPAPARVPPQAHDNEVARRLWDLSERLTGVTFDSLSDHVSRPTT